MKNVATMLPSDIVSRLTTENASRIEVANLWVMKVRPNTSLSASLLAIRTTRDKFFRGTIAGRGIGAAPMLETLRGVRRLPNQVTDAVEVLTFSAEPALGASLLVTEMCS
jgi:hypothetical protein